MAKKKTNNGIDDRDELLATICSELNKASKTGKVAYLMDDLDNPAHVNEWVGTGSTLLDLAISNRPNAGLPVGKILEINGLEGTGKSLLAASAVAETQKLGGTAVYIDTENAISSEFWSSFGVDITKMMHIPAETIEDVFDHIEKIVTIVRKSSEDKLLTIVIDSVAGASCRTELESEHGKDGYATTKSIVISKALRKITNMLGKKRVLTIFTNQLRQNLNATAFGDKWITPGGKALPFHSSVRIRLSTIKKLKDKDGQEIGCVCQAKIVKNRMGPPNRVVTFDIYYDSGIADYASWIKVLKEKKIIRQAGAYCKYTKDNGEEIQFQSGTFVEMMESDEELKTEIYGKICDALIMKYKTPNSQVIDAVEVDEEDEEV